jgi:flagellar hook-basal body complex protein FliE
MVNGIGGSGAGRAAIEAALKQMQERAREMGASPDASVSGSTAAPESGFTEALKNGLSAVESNVAKTNEVHIDVVNGDLDLHEVAAQIKESEITFQFALTVRNKLMDAYREVMRMSV